MSPAKKAAKGAALAPIKANELVLPSIDIWFKRWFALTAGSMETFNSMTVAWGSVGGMWDMPFVQVVVRPTRHTFGFINDSTDFTLCSFPPAFRKDLALLGSKSGRDGDKIALTRLTVMKSEKVAAPCFKEADLVIECRKIYWQDLDERNFLSDKIAALYPQMDYHRVFFGEIVRIRGSQEFRKK